MDSVFCVFYSIVAVVSTAGIMMYVYFHALGFEHG